jgi:hypothetical protein
MGNMKTKALVYLKSLPEEAALLKRLALLFDEIHYVSPQAYSVTREALADKRVVKRTRSGKFILTQRFNFFQHVDREWSRMFSRSDDQELTAVLDPFKEAGIAFEVNDHSLIEAGNAKVVHEQIRGALYAAGVGNTIF